MLDTGLRFDPAGSAIQTGHEDRMERLYKKLETYGQEGYYPFHMPGHKRNKASVYGDFPIEQDITEIYGFDNLHHAEGIIKEAQEELARLYEVKQSFLSVNGSTAAILSAISASVEKGGQILVARNCHKAVYHGIYLRDLEPIYIYPQTDSKLGINGEILTSRVERSLEENKNIQAVLITSPTYDGVVSDIQEIARIAHEHQVPLIVDEAHGAHFRYSSYFPVPAEKLGADVVIQSFHKTLPSMTQTAVLHRCSDLVDGTKLARFMDIYQTSSPSYVLMASIDACVDKMKREGTDMFRTFTRQLEQARRSLAKCNYIRLVPEPGNKEYFDFDRSKIILSTEHCSFNGTQLAKILRQEFKIEVEMETEQYVIAMAAVGDTEEGFLRLCEAIQTIDEREAAILKVEDKRTEYDFRWEEKKQFMSITQAMDAPSVPCPLEESAGKISTEFAYLYPPGIPILVPGEQITGLFIKNVRRYMEQGLNFQGLADNTNETIAVVKEL